MNEIFRNRPCIGCVTFLVRNMLRCMTFIWCWHQKKGITSHDFSLVLSNRLILFGNKEIPVRVPTHLYGNVWFVIGSLWFYSSKHLSFPSLLSDLKAFLLKLLISLLVSLSNFPLRTSLTKRFIKNVPDQRIANFWIWSLVNLNFSQSLNNECSNKVGYELELGSTQKFGLDLFQTRVRDSSNKTIRSAYNEVQKLFINK